MCGIFGFLGTSNEELILDSAKNVQNILAHRGPDDSGIFQDQESEITLVHTRLSIIEISSLGHQPMYSKDKKLVIVFNGEIYNFLELKEDLLNKGFLFETSSDTEVLLNLFIAYGKSMLSKINGIFAFAIWDQNQQSLFIARDAFGVKPLYYSASKNFFSFTSELKAFKVFDNEFGGLNADSIHKYLSFLMCPGEETPYKLVKKLLPGEAMIVNKSGVDEHWKWFNLPYTTSKKSPELNLYQSLNGLKKNLGSAVSRQMISDVPVGAFLSGGLDSSAIVSYAKEISPNIECFTINTIGKHDAGFLNDLPYAKKVAKYLGTPLNIIEVDASCIINDIKNMVIQLDEPLADPAALNVKYISQLARKNGVKVLLSGAGGDDLFTGYRRHQALLLEKWWNWLPEKILRHISTFSENFDHRTALGRRLAKLFDGANLSDDKRIINYFKWTKRLDLNNLYSDDFKLIITEGSEDFPMIDYLQNLPENRSNIEKMLSLEQRFFLTDHNLLYTDKMSMQAGVEVRVPFLDLDLVKFASKIPDKFKYRKNQSKWILKKAMEGRLPKDIIYRPKTGFGLPIRHWVRNELKEFIGDILSKESIEKRGFFNPHNVHKLIIDNERGKKDASYTIFSILCIEIWCRHFLDSKKIMN